jgi:hypothetical protein
MVVESETTGTGRGGIKNCTAETQRAQRIRLLVRGRGSIVQYDVTATQNTLNYSLRNLCALCVSAVKIILP